MSETELMKLTLDNIAKALGLNGGAKTVMYAFAPGEARDRLEPDDQAREAAVKFLNEVTSRAEALSLLDQAVTDARERMPVAVEDGVRDLVKQCELKREVIRLEGSKCNGLRIQMEPVMSGPWWSDQLTTLEAEDPDLGDDLCNDSDRLIFTVSRKSNGRAPVAQSRKVRK